MNLHYEEGYNINNFLFHNQRCFEEKLLSEAINVKDKIKEIHNIGNINLLENAQKLVLFVVEEREKELVSFAQQEGILWAKYSLTLAFKLEWIQAIRRTLWEFLFKYNSFKNDLEDKEDFFRLEKSINDLIDQFLTHFFISYSKFKDELLDKERKLVEHLSVPIIPINDDICVLPLIGNIDSLRITTLEEKVLREIERKQIQTLVMDLSGVASMEEEVTDQFRKIIEGVTLMGCKTILTGLRTEFVTNLVSAGVGFKEIAEFKGSLKLALNDILNKQYENGYFEKIPHHGRL